MQHVLISEGSDIIIGNELLSLIIYISRLYQQKINNEYIRNTKKEPIDDLIKYIGSNFGSPLTLEYLAEYVHLTSDSFLATSTHSDNGCALIKVSPITFNPLWLTYFTYSILDHL